MPRHRSLLIVATLVAAILVACNGDDDAATPTLTATPTATAPAVDPTATSTGTSEPGETASPTPTRGAQGPSTALEELIASLSTEAQPLEPDDEREMPAPPASPFPRHDQESTVIYDLETGEVIDLGPGQAGFVSTDGRSFAWMVQTDGGSEVRLLDLETRDERALDLGRVVQLLDFFDERRIAIWSGDGPIELVDVETGEREEFLVMEGPFQAWELQGDLMLLPDLDEAGKVPDPAMHELRNFATGETIATFRAMEATFAGPGELLIVTPLEGSIANIYVVNIEAVEVTLIATVTLEGEPILPASGSASLIAWAENYCGAAGEGRTFILDRESGDLTALGAPLWVTVTTEGQLGFGEFGPHVLVDAETLEYVAVLPEGTVDVNWSSDYRYASRGLVLGHGGHCPP